MLHSESTIGATLPAFTMAFCRYSYRWIYKLKQYKGISELNNHNGIYTTSIQDRRLTVT